MFLNNRLFIGLILICIISISVGCEGKSSDDNGLPSFEDLAKGNKKYDKRNVQTYGYLSQPPVLFYRTLEDSIHYKSNEAIRVSLYGSPITELHDSKCFNKKVLIQGVYSLADSSVSRLNRIVDVDLIKESNGTACWKK